MPAKKTTKKATKKVATKKSSPAKTKSAAKKPAKAKKSAVKKAASASARKSSAKKQPTKAAKKPATKKVAAKKAKPAAKKAAPKKAAAKKSTVKKTVAKKGGAKKAPAKKGAAKKATTRKQTKGGKTRAKKAKSSSSAAISVPTASVARTKAQRPNAFTLDDIDEILKGRPVSTPRTGKTSAATRKPAQAPKTVEEEPVVAEKRVHGPASLEDILGFNPEDKVKPEERALSDIPKKFHRYYKQLQRMRKEIVEALEFHTEETLKRSAKEDSGDLSSYSQHQADAGTDNYDRDFALSLVSDEQELLFEVEEAIKRIHRGTYGICEVNGKPINRERLNAVPFARYSLEGQIEFEKTQRRRTQRGGIFDSALDDPSTFGGDDDGDD